MKKCEQYPFRLVFLGGPFDGAIVDQACLPETVLEMTRPVQWCVCPDGSVVETSTEVHVYRLRSLTQNGHRKDARYLCDGWGQCNCGRFIPQTETSCARCRRDREEVSA